MQKMKFNDLFGHGKPLIAVIHLGALPGAPAYGGNPFAVYDKALEEAAIFTQNGADAIIIENFRDVPFYPDRVPAETIAAMAAVTREIVKSTHLPVGVNVLRNDADAALSIAAATGAKFIRVNVHNAASLTDQGIVQGRAYETLRKRNALGAEVLIFADVAVKHATPLAPVALDVETRDLCERSLADAIIVSGTGTGQATDLGQLEIVKNNSDLPVLIGSGTRPDTLRDLNRFADGYIVGSHFKKGGIARNDVDPARVREFAELFRTMK